MNPCALDDAADTILIAARESLNDALSALENAGVLDDDAGVLDGPIYVALLHLDSLEAVIGAGVAARAAAKAAKRAAKAAK